MSEDKKPKVKLYWNDVNMTYDKTISVEAETLDEAREGFLFIKKEMKVNE